MKRVWLVVIVCVLLQVHAGAKEPGENLLRNGDFAQGNRGWRGDAQAAVLDRGPASPTGTACLAIQLDKKRVRLASASVRVPRKTDKLSVELKVRFGPEEGAEEALSPMVILRMAQEEKAGNKKKKKNQKDKARPGPTHKFLPEAGSEWKTISWQIGSVKDPKSFDDFEIECGPGVGILYIDDVVITASQSE